MKPLFDIGTINELKGNDKIPFECYHCKDTYYPLVKDIRCYLKNIEKYEGSNKYCSYDCLFNSKITRVTKNCAVCNKETTRMLSEFKKIKIRKYILFKKLLCNLFQ
jgi:hypothetical protein